MSNEHTGPADYSWAYDPSAIDWEDRSGLYRIAPLGDKRAWRRRSTFVARDWPAGGVAGPGRCHRHAPPVRWAGVCLAPASRRGRAGALAAGRRVAVGPRGVVAVGVEHHR
jgi:hypothetical protein